jgi:hypothetical protein
MNKNEHAHIAHMRSQLGQCPVLDALYITRSAMLNAGRPLTARQMAAAIREQQDYEQSLKQPKEYRVILREWEFEQWRKSHEQ